MKDNTARRSWRYFVLIWLVFADFIYLNNTNMFAPERDYPASKVAAEKLLSDSGRYWSILRFGFVYHTILLRSDLAIFYGLNRMTSRVMRRNTDLALRLWHSDHKPPNLTHFS